MSDYKKIVIGGTDHFFEDVVLRDGVAGKAGPIINTVNGPVASFSDGADNRPVRDLKVGIVPVQDLHGQDAPYPAGGGAQKWDEEWEVGTIADADGQNNDSVTSLIRSKNYIPASAETEYYAQLSGKNAHIFCYDSSKAYLGYLDRVGNGTFTTLASTAYIRFRMNTAYGTTYNHNIAINYPSSVTTYSPYSNLCPITGWTGCNVYDDPAYGGFIEWNQLLKDGNFTDTSKWYVNGTLSKSVSDNVITLTATADNVTNSASISKASSEQNPKQIVGHKYLASVDVNPSVAVSVRYSYSTAAENTQAKSVNSGAWTRYANIVSAKTNADFILYFNVSGALNTNDTVKLKNFCVFDLTQMFGATVADQVYTMEQATAGSGVAWVKNLFPKDYYAYNTGTKTCVSAVNGDPYRHIPISWQSAGTVYGGTLDVTTGVLTVNAGYVDLGTLDWEYDSTYHRFMARLNGMRINQGARKTWMVCEAYEAICDGRAFSNVPDMSIYGGPLGGNPFVSVHDSRYTDATQFTVSGVHLVYELAAQTTVTLSPTELKTILGQNQIFADTGDVAVTYAADTKLFIDNKFAEMQALILEN